MERERMEEVCKKVLSFVRLEEAEVMVNASSGGLSRFANNTIEQNVNETGVSVTVRVMEKGRVGRASCNILDDGALERMVRAAEEMTKFVPEDKEALPLPEPQEYQRLEAFVEATANCTPKQRAEAVSGLLKKCRKEGVTAAGIVSSDASYLALANSNGLFAFQKVTEADYSVTVMTDGSAGWAREMGRDFTEIDFEGASERAFRKALDSRNPRDIEPGEYDVVLEPPAVGDLVMFLAWLTFGALPFIEGRSYFSGKLGEKVFDEKLNIDDDVYHPLSGGIPFDFEGMPRKKVTLVENGVAKAVVHSRKTAKKLNTETTGHGLPEPNTYGPIPLNLVVHPGDATLEEMIESTERGILDAVSLHQLHRPDEDNSDGDDQKRHIFDRERQDCVSDKESPFHREYGESVFEHRDDREEAAQVCKGFFGGGPVVPAMKIRNFRFTSTSEST